MTAGSDPFEERLARLQDSNAPKAKTPAAAQTPLPKPKRRRDQKSPGVLLPAVAMMVLVFGSVAFGTMVYLSQQDVVPATSIAFSEHETVLR